jgi:hypothetical protein
MNPYNQPFGIKTLPQTVNLSLTLDGNSNNNNNNLDKPRQKLQQRSKKRKCNSYSNRDNCYFQIRFYRPKRSAKWTMTQDQHGMTTAFTTTSAKHCWLNKQDWALDLYWQRRVVQVIMVPLCGQLCGRISSGCEGVRRFMGTKVFKCFFITFFFSPSTLTPLYNTVSTTTLKRRTHSRLFTILGLP